MRDIFAPVLDITVVGEGPPFPTTLTYSYLSSDLNQLYFGIDNRERFTEDIVINVLAQLEMPATITESDEISFSLQSSFADLAISIYDGTAPLFAFSATDSKSYYIDTYNNTLVVDDRAINFGDEFFLSVGGVNSVIPALPLHFGNILNASLESESRIPDARFYNTDPEELNLEIIGRSSSVFTKTGYLGYSPAIVSGYIDIKSSQDSLNSGENIFGSYVYRYPNINENGDAVPRQRQIWTI
jgi:hypothetical protein